MSFFKSDYAFDLPAELIASQPMVPKDASRLLVLDRQNQTISSQGFQDLVDHLEEGSLLVVNDTKVIPARLPGEKETGAKIEALLVEEAEQGLWWAKIKNSARLKQGARLWFCGKKIGAVLMEKGPDGQCLLLFDDKENLFSLLFQHAFAPIPPYIHKARAIPADRTRDIKDYQTLFAQKEGAIAAPTAGLHFTQELLDRLCEKGIDKVEITLHVGLGTFEAMRVEDIRHHKMHSERFEITEQTASKIERAKKEGRKIVAVGTTSTRALEAAFDRGRLRTGEQKTDIFIHPPYKFKVVDQLITNFHLPESTLLMLVAAFGGKEFVMRAYSEAVKSGFRFYSYGDGMLIL